MPRQEGDEHGGRARGGVRPQPAEGVQSLLCQLFVYFQLIVCLPLLGVPVRHQAGAQPEAGARVHRHPAGDVQPQVHAAAQGAEAAHLRVVPGRLAARPRPGG